MAVKQSKQKDQTPSQSEGKIQQLVEYFEESKAEIKKVTWPTRKEAKVTSFAVLILVVVMSLFLSFVDLGLTKVVELILTSGV